MDEVQKGIGNKISAEVAKHCAPALEALTAGPASGAQPPTQASKLTGRREEAYQHARRSLKVWPVEGDDLEEALNSSAKPGSRSEMTGLLTWVALWYCR